MKVSRDGGTPVTLAADQKEPSHVALDSTSAYWTSSGDGTVMKLTPK